MQYSRASAKGWTAASGGDICNVIKPSISADLTQLNTAGIRQDVRRDSELGWLGPDVRVGHHVTPFWKIATS